MCPCRSAKISLLTLIWPQPISPSTAITWLLTLRLTTRSGLIRLPDAYGLWHDDEPEQPLGSHTGTEIASALDSAGWKVRFMVRYLVVDYGPGMAPRLETGNSREPEASGQFPTKGFSV